MNKRQFLKTSSIISVATVVNPFFACTSSETKGGKNNTEDSVDTELTGNFEVPKLDFSFDALEPHIDKRTMEIHHDKHHAGYVKKLNSAVENTDWAKMQLDEMMGRISESEKDTAIRNNGGGHYNHSLFWSILSPKNQKPEGNLLDALKNEFDNTDKFKEEFDTTAKSVFGSGWAWLCVDDTKKLFITSTPNQDNPLMANLVEKAGTPILGLDVWEHAYYLNYQNQRMDYIESFWNVVNWEEVAKRYNDLV